MSKDKKSILEEATTDLMEIVEVAKKQAKDDLAKKFPEKFDMLLKEEIKKISSKESVKESGKDKNKEPMVEGKKTDKKKTSIREDFNMTDFSMSEVEDAFDSAGENDSFSVLPDEETSTGDEMSTGNIGIDDIGTDEVTVDSIADAINSMDDLNGEREMAQESQTVSDPYTKFKEMYEQMGKYVKEMEDQKMHEEYGAEFDSQMSGLYGEGYKDTLGEEKCGELKEMFIAHKKGAPFKGGAVNEADDQPFKDKSNPSTEQGKSIAEMHNTVPRGATAPFEKGHNTTPSGITEKWNFEKKDDDKDEDEDEVKVEIEVEREEEDKVDETASSSKMHTVNRTVGNERLPHSSPRKDSTQREFQKETYEKRMKSLIEENKKLTKEVNVAKKSFGKAEKLIETYKTYLDKYRNQLNEMAIFNTNLANVNNLLINEELALTKNDKISIINTFKKINSINESDNAYGKVLTEMKKGRKTISEDVEATVSKNTIEKSSKNKIDEAIERTAYENNSHVENIKRLMNYVDKK